MCGNFRPFENKNVQIWDHFFPILIPKYSKSLKSLEIGLQEVGEKRTLNGMNLVCTCRRTYLSIFKARSNKKIFFFFLQWFFIISKQQYLNLRPLLSITFPQVFRIVKKFRDWTSGNECKKSFKWSEQSVTFTQTHIRT